MSSTTAAAAARIQTVQTERNERLFYLMAALVMIAGVAIGFHMFYLHGLNDAGQPVTQQSARLVYIHGGLMTGWMILFLLQCGLVVKGNRRLHMRLGGAAVVLYVVIVPVGAIAALLQIHYADPPSFPPFGPYRFLMLPLTEIANFALFVGAAFLFRPPLLSCDRSLRYLGPAKQLYLDDRMVAPTRARDNALSKSRVSFVGCGITCCEPTSRYECGSMSALAIWRESTFQS